jgi:hypothetical protein
MAHRPPFLATRPRAAGGMITRTRLDTLKIDHYIFY